MEYDISIRLPNRKYFCVHCRDLQEFQQYCYSFDSVDMVYGHWLSNHTDLPQALPFQFYAVDLVGCVHCRFIGLFGRLRDHHDAKHPNQPFATARAANRNECALCPFGGPSLIKHFQENHVFLLEVNLFNPVCFTPDTLTELLAIDIRDKQICGHCNVIFETIHEADIHHYKMHPDVNLSMVKWNVAAPHHISFLICAICKSRLEPHQFNKHIEQEMATFNLSLYGNHSYKADPNSQANDFAQTYFKLLGIFMRTKVVFGNGLVAFKQNLLFSRYDDILQFEEVAKRIASVKSGSSG